jgi:hypothetical protein
LTLQQSPKHPGLVSRFLHEHHVLNLTSGHNKFDTLLWESILEDSKLSRVLVGWIVWIHEKLQLYPLRLVHVRPINLVRLLHLGNRRNGEFSRTEGGKAASDLEILLITIVWIDFAQQNFDESALC